ncbi:hypothetical protein [Listeria booriae]|uniref:hypothetical protein n=1 Tax=Listeria booriae TaxID=1552123 RepID=UPI0016255CF4|nr:hypothetical protein [Listeria booriae]MBC2147314.1 hypothetical protein [Listeria booriae]
MQFTKIFNVAATQKTVDFVNIEVGGDQPFYIDPSIIAGKNDKYAVRAKESLKDFFEVVHGLYESKCFDEARGLLLFASENDAIHFGQTRKGKKSDGTGCSTTMLVELFEKVHEKGRIAKRMLLEPYHSYLFIDGIAEDRMSDLISNVILDVLCDFTKEQCDLLGVPTQFFKDYRYYWNVDTHEWSSKSAFLPVDGEGNPILLVPKNFITNRFKLNVGTLIFQYILPLEMDKLGDKAPSNKKDLWNEIRGEHSQKDFAALYCSKYPEVYREYCRRTDHRIQGRHPGELTDLEIEAIVSFSQCEEEQA